MNISREKIGKLNCLLVKRTDLKKPYAVVILCHGFGAPGQDLVPLGAELADQNEAASEVLYIFPAAPHELDFGYEARAWWMIDIERLQYLMAIGETREMRNADPPELPECRALIGELIEAVRQKYDLPSNRVIVGGFSQGSMLATDVALHYPHKLAGLIVWSGALICESAWKAAAEKQAKLKIVQTHGRQDMILSLSGALDLKSMLENSGHDVRFHQFNGPHTIPMEGIVMAAELIATVNEQETR